MGQPKDHCRHRPGPARAPGSLITRSRALPWTSSTSSGSRSGSWCSALLFDDARDDGQVLLTESWSTACCHSSARQARRAAGVTGRPEGQARPEREPARTAGELAPRRSAAAWPPATATPAGHRPARPAPSWSALQPVGKSHRSGHRLIREREPGAVHQLQPRSGPGLTDPDQCAGPAHRRAGRPARALRRARTRRSSAGRVPRILTARHRRIQQHHIRALGAGQGATRSIPATPMVLIWAQIAPGASARACPGPGRSRSPRRRRSPS